VADLTDLPVRSGEHPVGTEDAPAPTPASPSDPPPSS
jgi:hypothetical protein